MQVQINCWDPQKGYGFTLVNGRRVFVHWSVLSPAPKRGADLTGRTLEEVQVDWAEPKGAKVTRAQWDRWAPYHEIRPAVYRVERFSVDEQIGRASLRRLPYELIPVSEHNPDELTRLVKLETSEPGVYMKISRHVPAAWGVFLFNPSRRDWTLSHLIDQDEDLEALKQRHAPMPVTNTGILFSRSTVYPVSKLGVEDWDEVGPSNDEVGELVTTQYPLIGCWTSLERVKYEQGVRWQMRAPFSTKPAEEMGLRRWFRWEESDHQQALLEGVATLVDDHEFFGALPWELVDDPSLQAPQIVLVNEAGEICWVASGHVVPANMLAMCCAMARYDLSAFQRILTRAVREAWAAHPEWSEQEIANAALIGPGYDGDCAISVVRRILAE